MQINFRRKNLWRNTSRNTARKKISRRSLGKKNRRKKDCKQTSAKKLRQQFAANSCRETSGQKKKREKKKHLQGNFGNEIFDEYIGRETCGRKIFEKTSAPKIRRKSMGEKNPDKKYWNQTSAKKLRQQFAANSCREILEKKNKNIFGDKLPEKWFRRSHSQRTSGQKKKGKKKSIWKETSGTKSSMNILAEKLVDEKFSKKHLHRNVWRNVWTNNPGRKQWQKTSGAEKLRRNRKKQSMKPMKTHECSRRTGQITKAKLQLKVRKQTAMKILTKKPVETNSSRNICRETFGEPLRKFGKTQLQRTTGEKQSAK